jgi:putative methionine-R-sulfoxide reductase with GAF domain
MVWGVLDIDSSDLNQFDSTDQLYLEKLVSFIPL